MQKLAYQWISRNDSHGIQQLHVFTPKDEKNTSTDKNVLSKLPTHKAVPTGRLTLLYEPSRKNALAVCHDSDLIQV